IGRDAKEGGDAGADLAGIGRQLRSLRDDDRVDVRNRKTPLLGQLARPLHEERAVGLLPPRIGVRKLLTDRSLSGGAEESISQRVEKGVTIGMPAESKRMSQRDAAQPQDPVRGKWVRIKTETDTELSHW